MRGQSTYKGVGVWKNRTCPRRLTQKLGVKRRLGKKSRKSRRGWDSGQGPAVGRPVCLRNSRLFHRQPGEGTEEIRRKGLHKYLGSHTDHKDSFSPRTRANGPEGREPLLNCGHLHLQSGARRGLGLWMMKGENIKKHRLSSDSHLVAAYTGSYFHHHDEAGSEVMVLQSQLSLPPLLSC